ncbi:F0F1 ATP synthase subunit B [Rhodospirillaceae bacterium KN72]|uniref:ATP synthase subunit b n=1 Tax=Pacificispira spongiicola TaxID=2729598 RepID=A0A7Y0E3H7_9PROT|nr:F0F1 ATP synthase subunit B [Pacificispira spongiicola]NMM46549.1 F0F1 ATP synthase subunit B [Pacificispira spongiicola]
MQIDWWTLALQAINFLVLVWLLKRFLYRPVKDVIAKRRALAEDALAKAAAKEAEADAEKDRLTAERDALARERHEVLKAAQKQTEADRAEILDKARAEASRIVAAAEAAIDRERQETLSGMKREIGQLAANLAAGILAQSDAAALANACLDHMKTQLEALPAEERDQMRAALTKGVTVVTAVPVADTGAWTAMIAAALGPDGRIDFDTDPSLIGGAELRFPHTTLKFSWADHLDQAGRILQGDDAVS